MRCKKLFFNYSKLTLPLKGATNVPLFADVENAATIIIGRTTNKSFVSVIVDE